MVMEEVGAQDKEMKTPLKEPTFIANTKPRTPSNQFPIMV
jgi:hypothetical protein